MKKHCKLTIRRITSSDISTLLQLCAELHDIHNPIPFDHKWKQNWLIDFVKHKKNIVLIAVIDAPVAYLISECLTEEYTKATYLHIREIYVRPHHQNNGIGKKLLDNASRIASSWNCRFISLNVKNGNPAFNFFAAKDFSLFSSQLRKLL